MGCMKSYFLIILGIALSCTAIAQNFTTKGVEFWAAYGAHTSMYNEDGTPHSNGGSQKMLFYFLGNKPTTVTVEIPALGWSRTYQLTSAAAIQSDEMPKAGADDIRLLEEGVWNKGIHITSDERITAYCHIFDDQSSATTLLIPVNISGQEYYSLNYMQQSGYRQARSYCFVIATEDNTEVEVTPSVNTIGHAAGVPFTQTLQKGQVLNLFGEPQGKQDGTYTGADLSGTYIRTVSSPNREACKRIIVFSGSSATSVACKENRDNSADNLLQQVPATSTWGNNFLAVPTLHMPNNYYRVIVQDKSKKVYINGQQLLGIKQGRYYDVQTNTVSSIYSDGLILVAQYISTAGQCGNGAGLNAETGDPEMIYLTPQGNGINSIWVTAPAKNNLTNHYVNLIIKANDVDSFRLDGKTMPEQFTIYNRNRNYATAQIEILPGKHVLKADSSIIAYAYGYGPHESYGYNGGFAVSHVSGSLGVVNPYAAPASLDACTATPFRLYFDVEEELTHIEWKFSGNPYLYPNADVAQEQPVADSIYTRRGATIYRYYLPGNYQYNVAAALKVKVLTSLFDGSGCTAKKQFDFSIDVQPKPVAGWSLQYNNCANNSLSFEDKSETYNNTALVKWQWSFGNGHASEQRNPQQQFADFGEYTVQLRVINSIGCYDDTAESVGMYHQPVAAFNVAGTPCSQQEVFFNSEATVENDEITNWTWQFGDGTTSGAKNPVKQFADSATYEVRLIAKSKHGCADTAVNLVRIYKSPQVQLPPVLFSVPGDTIRLKPSYTGNIKSYSWTPATYLSSASEPSPVAAPANDITYSVTAIAADAPCKAMATTTIKLQQKLFIPNAFTPNSDGLNDTWRIKNIEGYAQCVVQVFNRWGNRVFYSRGYPSPWNGSFNGKPLPTGAYFYSIHTNSPHYNAVLTGSLTLIR